MRGVRRSDRTPGFRVFREITGLRSLRQRQYFKDVFGAVCAEGRTGFGTVRRNGWRLQPAAGSSAAVRYGAGELLPLRVTLRREFRRSAEAETEAGWNAPAREVPRLRPGLGPEGVDPKGTDSILSE